MTEHRGCSLVRLDARTRVIEVRLIFDVLSHMSKAG